MRCPECAASGARSRVVVAWDYYDVDGNQVLPCADQRLYAMCNRGHEWRTLRTNLATLTAGPGSGLSLV